MSSMGGWNRSNYYRREISVFVLVVIVALFVALSCSFYGSSDSDSDTNIQDRLRSSGHVSTVVIAFSVVVPSLPTARKLSSQSPSIIHQDVLPLSWANTAAGSSPFTRQQQQQKRPRTTRTRTSSRLWYGTGIADSYSWYEEAFEMEVTVKVPKEISSKDITFQSTSKSIGLKYKSPGNNTETVLLDPQRPLKGRIVTDGTYWVISDAIAQESYRNVTVTIEKLVATPVDDFQIVDYDWKGVYANERPNEIFFRKYDEPEVLNVREYAKSLGVDPDNINMTLVDKSLYTTGLNSSNSLTKQEELMERWKEAGLVKEVTEQGDSSQYTVNEETGMPERFAPLGETMEDERKAIFQQKEQQTTTAAPPPPPIPFLDTPSPWHNNTTSSTRSTNTAPTTMTTAEEEDEDEANQRVEDLDIATSTLSSSPTTLAPVAAVGDSSTVRFVPTATYTNTANNETIIRMTRNLTRAAFAADAAAAAAQTATTRKRTGLAGKEQQQPRDPIDQLTVQRLKDILKSQGLKTTGSKEELQQRLRQQVNALLQGNSNAAASSSQAPTD